MIPCTRLIIQSMAMFCKRSQQMFDRTINKLKEHGWSHVNSYTMPHFWQRHYFSYRASRVLLIFLTLQTHTEVSTGARRGDRAGPTEIGMPARGGRMRSLWICPADMVSFSNTYWIIFSLKYPVQPRLCRSRRCE